MEEAKVLKFLTDKKEFLFGSRPLDRDIIENMLVFSDENFPILEYLPMRKPSTAKLIAMIPGIIGFDCFYLGDIKRGLVKYFTFGGLGILWLKDLKNAEEKCREYNRKRFMEVLKDPSVGIKIIEKSAKAKKAFDMTTQIGTEVIKGAKDIQKTMYIR